RARGLVWAVAAVRKNKKIAAEIQAIRRGFGIKILRDKLQKYKVRASALSYNSYIGGGNGKLEAGIVGRFGGDKRGHVSERQPGCGFHSGRSKPGDFGVGVSREVCRVPRKSPALRRTRNPIPGCRISCRRTSGRSCGKAKLCLVRDAAR